MKEKVLELLEDVCYDICDMFKPEEVANLVVDIVNKLDSCSHVDGKLGKYQFKVNNTIRGFVSCADTEYGSTAVSDTLYMPYFVEHSDDEEEDATKDGLRSLIEMINESWYHCECA